MLTIGKLGEAAGVKVPTIRYYEQIGILPEPERSAGNQRLYIPGVRIERKLKIIRIWLQPIDLLQQWPRIFGPKDNAVNRRR